MKRDFWREYDVCRRLWLGFLGIVLAFFLFWTKMGRNPRGVLIFKISFSNLILSLCVISRFLRPWSGATCSTTPTAWPPWWPPTPILVWSTPEDKKEVFPVNFDVFLNDFVCDVFFSASILCFWNRGCSGVSRNTKLNMIFYATIHASVCVCLLTQIRRHSLSHPLIPSLFYPPTHPHTPPPPTHSPTHLPTHPSLLRQEVGAGGGGAARRDQEGDVTEGDWVGMLVTSSTSVHLPVIRWKREIQKNVNTTFQTHFDAFREKKQHFAVRRHSHHQSFDNFWFEVQALQRWPAAAIVGFFEMSSAIRDAIWGHTQSFLFRIFIKTNCQSIIRWWSPLSPIKTEIHTVIRWESLQTSMFP